MARRKTVTEAEMRLTARDHTRAVISRVQRSLRTLSRAAVRVGAAMAGGFAVGAAALTQMTRRGLENVDAMAKQADMVNMSVQALAGFQRQASRAGIPVDTFNRNLEKMSVNLAQAEQGLGQATRGLEAIGLAVEDVADLTADEQLFAIARAMEDVESHAVRTAAAYDIFGQRGVRMLKIMEDGEEAMRAANKRAEELGLTVSDFDAAAVQKANDDIDEMGQLFSGLQNQLAARFAPAISDVAQRITEFSLEFGGMGKVADFVLDKLVKGAVFTANAWAKVSATFQVIRQVVRMTIAGWLAAATTAVLEIINLVGTAKVAISNDWERIKFAAEVVWDGIKYAIAITAQAILRIIHNLATKALIPINKIIDGLNAIPGVDLGNISIDGFTEKLDSMGAKADQALADLTNKLSVGVELQDFEEGPVAAGIRNFRDNMVDEFKQLASEFPEIMAKFGERPGDELLEWFEGLESTAVGVAEKTREEVQKTASMFDKLAPHVGKFANALEDSLLRAAENGKFAIGDLARFVIAEINRMAIRAMILRPLVGGMGGMFAGTAFGDSLTETAQSFAGGGSTGSGPRTGGLDGRGGFPAILHPNETVVDHSQGQQTGGTYYIDARGADSSAIARLENMIANMGGRIRNESQAAVQQAFQRHPQFGTR